MSGARTVSIRERLTAIIMAASSISVLLTTLTISVIGVYTLRQDLLSELVVSASLVGDRNTAALLFNDDKLAANNMQVFTARRSVLRACLYDRDGKVFASYFNENEPAAHTCPQDQAEREVLGQTAEVMMPIVRMNDRIGNIYIESDLKDIQQYVRKQGAIAIGVTVAVLVVSYLLALGLQRSISAPILSLAATAREVSLYKDYTVRASPFGARARRQSSELTVLTESFNSMLFEIGEREGRLKRQNVELEKARDAAEAANRAKSQFLANISHELRTPLNAIIGFSSILMNQLFGPLGDGKYVEYANDINHSGTHLLDIINDILDLARAEAGKLELSYEEMTISKVLQKCLAILGEQAERRKIVITSDVPRSLPTLHADRLRFTQILLNIISNAIKFTPEQGKVHISIAAAGEPAQFTITVQDNGIGMTEADIQKAFQSFGQVDSDLNRKYEGTGLGLPLTRKLLELHGGTITLQSQPGVGTKVVMTLPVGPKEGVGVE